MTTFVVVAAGRGSRLGRVGDELHKALVPLAGRAVLSRQFDLAPTGARIVVVTGYRADQLRDYVKLAHPKLDVEFVHDENWGNGPGASLLAAQEQIDADDDLIWTACDTLWESDDTLWVTDNSWIGVAPIPAGTPAARWCRVVPTVDGDFVQRIDDKTPDVDPRSLASVACGYVVADDLELFWNGLQDAEHRSGEVQFSSGLENVLNVGRPLELRHIRWLDVGDEQAYRSARASFGAYDPVKPGQATYVLPDTGRVVKFNADATRIARRAWRGRSLDYLVPRPVETRSALETDTLLGFEYIAGPTAYDLLTGSPRDVSLTLELVDYWVEQLWPTRNDVVVEPPNWYDTVMKFYRDKTFARVMALPRDLQSIALDVVTRVDWHQLIEGSVPGKFHGDFTFANVVRSEADGTWYFIDWREDFGDEVEYGDLRYDLGKLIGGCQFHWQNATYGDFRGWEYGYHQATAILIKAREIGLNTRDVERIGALTLINSAPLHAAPMDEILVTRGARWLERLT